MQWYRPRLVIIITLNVIILSQYQTEMSIK